MAQRREAEWVLEESKVPPAGEAAVLVGSPTHPSRTPSCLPVFAVSPLDLLDLPAGAADQRFYRARIEP